MNLIYLFAFFCHFFFCEDGMHDFASARQALCHQATPTRYVLGVTNKKLLPYVRHKTFTLMVPSNSSTAGLPNLLAMN